MQLRCVACAVNGYTISDDGCHEGLYNSYDSAFRYNMFGMHQPDENTSTLRRNMIDMWLKTQMIVHKNTQVLDNSGVRYDSAKEI